MRAFNAEQIGLKNLVPPILLEHVLRTTVGMVNVAFLSHISDHAVSAAGVSNQYIMMCQIIASAVATGTIVCINQAIGMKNMEKTEKLATIAFAANATLGLIFSALFLLFSRPFLSIMNLGADTIQEAAQYMRIVGGTMVLQCCEIVLSNVSRSVGKTRAPLVVNLVENGVNLLGCYLVVFQPIALPLHGVAGVAVVNVCSKVVGLALASAILHRAGVRLSVHFLRPFPWGDFKLSLSIGIPAGVNNIAYSASQLVTTSLISLTGPTMVSAKIYITNIVGYVALVGQSCAQANSILIGYRVGAGDYDGAMALRARVTRIALTTNTCFSLLLVLVRVPLLRLFTQDPVILSVAAGVMLLDLFVEIGRALNNSISGALQAVGDVNFQLIVNQSCAWLISVGMSYVLGIALGQGLYGIWAAFALDELTRGLILLFRWRSRRWIPKAEQRRRTIAESKAPPVPVRE